MTKKQTVSYWEKNLESVGLLPEIKEVYLNYLIPLVEKGIPIIFDFEHLSLLLGRTQSYLASVINSNSKHYRRFKIPKRKSGFREITAPYPALLECQYWIYENVLKGIEIHPCAHGFTFNKSIITNSSFHINKPHFLKIDLKDFFPSIKIQRVIFIFRKLGYSNKISFYLARLCCHNNELPQGAPTSPIISNIIAKQLDIRLLSFAKKMNLYYTRYADDLAFSGNKINTKLIEYISNIIKDCGFEDNGDKTILQTYKGKRVLAGVSIADTEIKLPRSYKRKLRQEIHFIREYGLTSHILKLKIRHPNYLQSIIGKVTFWLNIEPNCKFALESLSYLKKLEN
jgi:RNA-directed DNA polymerase